jgi:hypothetical protein
MRVKPKPPTPQPNSKQKTTKTQKNKNLRSPQEVIFKNPKPHKTKNKYKCQTDAVLYKY